MPVKVKPQITAWSYSRWSDYEQCPLKAKLKYIDKIKELGSPAMERGSMIHTLAENFVKGPARAAVPAELKPFAKEFRELRKIKATAEDSWAFTKTWEPTGWFDYNAWCRVKMDVFYMKGDTLVVIDHKTGKPREGNEDQLSLYAVAGFAHEPTAKRVSAELWYLDAGERKPLEYTREQFDQLKYDWVQKVKPMLNDTRFAPCPGNHCRWCYFRKNGPNGGPCVY